MNCAPATTAFWSDVNRAKAKLLDISRRYEDLPVLPDIPDRRFIVLPGSPVELVYRGLPLDMLEDLLPTSGAYRHAAPSPIRARVARDGTAAHAAARRSRLLATSGLLNGVFGAGTQRHVACWESIKVTDRFEETEDGVTTRAILRNVEAAFCGDLIRQFRSESSERFRATCTQGL